MDTAIKKAYELCGFANQQELDAWDLERRREKARFDMGSRLSSARREGKEEKALEIARNLLAKGSTPEFVQDTTGLDMEIIQGLQ